MTSFQAVDLAGVHGDVVVGEEEPSHPNEHLARHQALLAGLPGLLHRRRRRAQHPRHPHQPAAQLDAVHRQPRRHVLGVVHDAEVPAQPRREPLGRLRQRTPAVEHLEEEAEVVEAAERHPGAPPEVGGGHDVEHPQRLPEHRRGDAARAQVLQVDAGGAEGVDGGLAHVEVGEADLPRHLDGDGGAARAGDRGGGEAAVVVAERDAELEHVELVHPGLGEPVAPLVGLALPLVAASTATAAAAAPPVARRGVVDGVVGVDGDVREVGQVGADGQHLDGEVVRCHPPDQHLAHRLRGRHRRRCRGGDCAVAVDGEVRAARVWRE